MIYFCRKHRYMELLETQQMADFLGVSRQTVYNLIREGKLRGYVSKIGRKYVTTRERLEKFFEDATLDELL